MDNLEAVDTAGEPAADAPGHTPEPLVEEADAVVEEVVEADETPEADETEESVESDDDSPVVEELEEESFIPADDKIDKLRIPKEDREQLKKVAQLARDANEKLENFGEFGLNVLEPLAKVITKASISDDEGAQILHQMAEANGEVTYQLLFGGATALMQDPEAANQLLGSVFKAENATVDNIKSLLKLDKEGYIDRDFLTEDTEVLALKEENERLKGEIKAKNLPKPDIRGERASKDFETDFHQEIPQKLEGIFQKVSWDKEGQLAKLVTELIAYRLKSDEKYKDTSDFLQQTGSYRNGDKRVGVADANLMVLKNKALAQGTEMIREIQKEFKAISERSRNRVLAEKQKKAKEVTTTVPVPLPAQGESPDQQQERARQAYIAALAG